MNNIQEVKKDGRESIRTYSEAELYKYKAAFDVMLEYIHLGLDLNSASIEESNKSILTENMVGYHKYISERIDHFEKIRPGTKNKYKIF